MRKECGGWDGFFFFFWFSGIAVLYLFDMGEFWDRQLWGRIPDGRGTDPTLFYTYPGLNQKQHLDGHVYWLHRPGYLKTQTRSGKAWLWRKRRREVKDFDFAVRSLVLKIALWQVRIRNFGWGMQTRGVGSGGVLWQKRREEILLVAIFGFQLCDGNFLAARCMYKQSWP